MKRILKISLWILPFTLLSIAFTNFPNTKQEFEISKNLEIFANVYKELNADYVDELDPGKVMRDGVDAMLNNLDPFTNYIPESDIERYRLLREGTFNGVGAEFKKIGDYVTFTELFEKQPADKAGVKVGDQIIAIDGKETKGKSSDEVDYFLRGAQGTSAELTLSRPGQANPIKVKITREELEVPNVPYSGLVDGDIAYVSLSTFSQNAGKNVGDAIRDLRQQKPDLKGIILDLRGNGGGLLIEAVNLCNVFVPKGEIVVTTKGKLKENFHSYRTNNAPVDTELPLTILIDKNSASASEIVSGVIQDYDRGVLLGQRSYGKGLVQNTTDVGYNSRLKLTTAKYYIPSGRCIQSVEYKNGEPVELPDSRRNAFKTRNGRMVLDGGGVSPDVKVPSPSNIPVIKVLQDQDLIFRFVTDFCKSKPTIPAVDQFKFTDFPAFLAFVQQENTVFRTESEKLLEQFKTKATEEGYALEGVKTLEDNLQKAQLDLINKNKDVITKLIEKEIAGRYYYATGKTKMGLLRDSEVEEAIQMIKTPAKYRLALGK